jgi:hypothetical protein
MDMVSWCTEDMPASDTFPASASTSQKSNCTRFCLRYVQTTPCSHGADILQLIRRFDWAIANPMEGVKMAGHGIWAQKNMNLTAAVRT